MSNPLKHRFSIMNTTFSSDNVARVRSSELLAKLQLEDLDLILRERRLRWFGHVERSSGAIRTAYDMQIDGKRGTGRPKQTWKELTEKDCHEWKLTTVDPQERSTWRSGLKVIELEYILRLKIKRNDWLIADTCPQAANHYALF